MQSITPSELAYDKTIGLVPYLGPVSTPLRDSFDASHESGAVDSSEDPSQPIVQGIRTTFTPEGAQAASQVSGTVGNVNQINTGVQNVHTEFAEGENTPVGPSAVGKALVPVGLAFSPLSADRAFNELQHGDKVDGGFDAASTASSLTAGGIGTARTLDIAGAASCDVLGTVGGVAGGGFAVLDGAKGMYDGIRDHSASQTALGGVEAAAGGAMMAGAVTGDPFLLGAGAITYGGVKLWENRKAIGHLADSAWHGLENADHWVGDEVDKGVQDVAKDGGHLLHDAEKAGGHLVHDVAKTADHIGHDVAKMAGRVGHDIASAGHRVGHDVSQVGHRITHDVGGAARRVGHDVSSAAHKVGHALGHAAHKVASTVGHAAKSVFHAISSLF